MTELLLVISLTVLIIHTTSAIRGSIGALQTMERAAWIITTLLYLAAIIGTLKALTVVWQH